ncbi:MAG: glycosyltransferase family 4 protein [Ilumatobacteraceae bacterium]
MHHRLTGTAFITKILRSGELGDLYRLRQKRFGERRFARLIRDADAFVAISREIDDELAAAGVESHRRLRIPNGVDTDRFHPATDSDLGDRLRDELDRPGPIVVAVGRMTPEKRMRELSERWHLVRDEHPWATLVIHGKVVNRIDPDAVRLHDDPGVVNPGARADIEHGLRAADLYVSASAAEGLSNALLEAMASGLACVVTDVGGVRDVIDDGVNGVIVTADDMGALVTEINRLLGDPDTRASLGDRARETVVARFGLDAVADSLTAAYRRLAARPASG